MLSQYPCRSPAVSDACLRALWLLVLLLGSAGVTADAFERHTAHGGPVRGLALSPDGRWLVSTSFDYTAVLWSVDGLTERRRLIGHEAAVNAAAFSPDGRFLVTAGDDLTLRVWSLDELLDDRRTPQPRVLRGHTAKVVHLSFSPDGHWLASSSWDHSIGLWAVPGFTLRGFLSAHEGPVNAAQFSSDGRQLYSAGGDGHIRLWDLRSGKYLKSVVENGWGINVLAVDEGLDLIAYGTANGRMRSASLSGTRPRHDYVVDGKPVLALALDSASRRIAFADAQGRVVIATIDGDIQRDFHAVMGPVWCLALMPGGESLVFAGLDDFVTRMPLDDAFLPAPLVSQGALRFDLNSQQDNGAQQFARKCSVCHSLDANDRRRAGPTLYGVVGRRAGSLPGYPFSAALSGAHLVWDEKTIDALFREGPEVVTPGSKMPLQRIDSATDRRDLIDFLKTAAH